MIRPRDLERRTIRGLPEAVHRAQVQLIRQRCHEVIDDPIKIPITMVIMPNQRRDGFAATTSLVKAAVQVTTTTRAAYSATANLTTTIVRHRHDVTQYKALLRVSTHLRHRHRYYRRPIFGISRRNASICWSNLRSAIVAAMRSVSCRRNAQNSITRRRQYSAKTRRRKLRRYSLLRILVEKEWTLDALVIAK